MKISQVIGVLVVIASLWVLFVNIKPYFDAVGFWSRIPFIGNIFVPAVGVWWLANFGLMTGLGVLLFIVGVWLIRR